MPAAAMAARSHAPRNAPRGPASRRGGVRTDRDGDLSMGIAVKGRGRIGKSTPNAPASRDLTSRTSRGGAKTDVLSNGARGAILRQAASGSVSMKEARPSAARGGLVELKVTGWDKSKASSDADGGVSSLIKWMEKKASNRLGSRRPVKIKKSLVDGTTLIVSVPQEEVAVLVRMNGWVWAGTTISIEQLGGSVQATTSPQTEDLKNTFRAVLERRYNFDTKLLDLSALGQDEELLRKKVFDNKSTTSKIFPALMKVLEISFETPDERHAAITSVSLANNELVDLTAVTTLSTTLHKLQNLDLSNNKLEKLSALQNWRRRFYHLQHLVLSNNPIEQNEPDYASEIVKWYPNLRMINDVQVRTDDDVVAKATATGMPFPIRSALFHDEGGIVENFIRTFFTGFDSDRTALVALYYDAKSDFSFAVNTQAPRDPAATEQTEKQEWDRYIRNSRNLKKITHLPARQNRLLRGTKAIADVSAAMPKTKHPDLASEARKWMIESHMQPGVPDPSGQSPNGVDGFMVTVHGEFEEVDGVSGQARKKRSFDRTFVLGPGGPSGVRVVNDMLTVRAYGGAQAFNPDNLESWTAPIQIAAAAATVLEGAAQVPSGLSIEVAEQMVAEMQKQTGMTVRYAKDCLDQVGWDFQKGLEAFANVKASLPADAFVQSV